MTETNILRKDQLEFSLREEQKLIERGELQDDNPFDNSPEFIKLCYSSRNGDLKGCQEAITDGANINARDKFDYTPLILASLCGHYEVVELLLESGALCERDTFQGERCLYNSLNDRIRNLLLSYDFSKSLDPLQPLASHITSLLSRDQPKTSDIVVTSGEQAFALHKFILAARLPFFETKLPSSKENNAFRVPSKFPPQSFEIAIKYAYLGEIPGEIGGLGTGYSEEEVLEGLDKISRLLEIPTLWSAMIEKNDRRLARQHKMQETQRARAQLEKWFEEKVLRYKIETDYEKAQNILWDRDNAIFADVLLKADEVRDEQEHSLDGVESLDGNIPVGPRLETVPESRHKAVLFPVHRAMLLRSEYFRAMFSSTFLEAQQTAHLQIVSIPYSPEVLQAVLRYMYTEKTDFPLGIAVDVLFAADLLLMEKLKNKTALIISTLGNGTIASSNALDRSHVNIKSQPLSRDEDATNPLDPFQILRAAWLLRVPRLESFAARYIAYRLEHYIELQEFSAAVRESAARIKNRHETDSVELIDDIRHYLSERFRLRFEGDGIEDMLDEEEGVILSDEQSPSELSQESLRSRPIEFYAQHVQSRNFRTLDGEVAGDEFSSDTINYRILLGKIDALLSALDLDV